MPIEPEVMEFKPGQMFRAHLMGTNPHHTTKIHIIYVLDSVYEAEKLIVFRYYGKYRQYWHELMYRDLDLTRAVLRAKK